MTLDLTLASLTIRWLMGWYLGGRLPTLEGLHQAHAALRQPERPARISVVVPARNEAASLPKLLRSLAAQSQAPLEVIVVDDHSTDGTAQIAAQAGVTVVRSPDLPPGWLGKPWACAQGAAVATGDVLVFLDADTVASRDCLRRLAGAVEGAKGLVSVAPYHDVKRPYEFASALFNLVAFMGVGASSIRRTARVTGAFGPCMAMRVQDYVAIGGHSAVRHEVLEDIALARLCRRHGIPIVNVAGAADLRFRMYPEGLAQLVEGWSKNFASGARHTPVLRLLAIVAWLSGLIEAGLGTIVGAVWLGESSTVVLWPFVLFYVLFAAQLWFLLHRLGNLAPVAFVHPLATLMFLAICARSALLTARGQVTWKGRTITIAPRSDPRV